MMCLPLVTGAQAGWPLTREAESHVLPSRLPAVPMRDEGNPVLYNLRIYQGPRGPGFAGRGCGSPESRSTTSASAPASASSAVSQPEFWLPLGQLLLHFLPALSQQPSYGFVIKSTVFQTRLSCHVNQGKFLGWWHRLIYMCPRNLGTGSTGHEPACRFPSFLFLSICCDASCPAMPPPPFL